MNVFSIICLIIVVLAFLFSIFLMIRPRGEKFLNLDKKWICFGGLGILFLATIIFYVAGYQPNNVVQTLIVDGVPKTFVINTMDLPGGAYFNLVNYLFIFTALVYCVALIKESSILGTIRQNKRQASRS